MFCLRSFKVKQDGDLEFFYVYVTFTIIFRKWIQHRSFHQKYFEVKFWPSNNDSHFVVVEKINQEQYQSPCESIIIGIWMGYVIFKLNSRNRMLNWLWNDIKQWSTVTVGLEENSQCQHLVFQYIKVNFDDLTTFYFNTYLYRMAVSKWY